MSSSSQSTWTFPTVVFPSIAHNSFHFILTNAETTSKIWFEDNLSKHQWSFEFDSVTQFGNGEAISRTALIAYMRSTIATMNDKCMNDEETIDLVFGNDSAATITLTLYIAGGTSALVYIFDMVAVEMSRIDILEAKLSDALEEIITLKMVQEECKIFKGESIYVVRDVSIKPVYRGNYVNWSTISGNFYTCDTIHLHEDEIRFDYVDVAHGYSFPAYKIESLTSGYLCMETFLLKSSDGSSNYVDPSSCSCKCPATEKLIEISGSNQYIFFKARTQSYIVVDKYSDKYNGNRLVLKFMAQETINPYNFVRGSQLQLLITRVA